MKVSPIAKELRRIRPCASMKMTCFSVPPMRPTLSFDTGEGVHIRTGRTHYISLHPTTRTPTGMADATKSVWADECALVSGQRLKLGHHLFAWMVPVADISE